MYKKPEGLVARCFSQCANAVKSKRICQHVVRVQICIHLIVTVQEYQHCCVKLKGHKNASLGSNFKFSCGFKFSTVEKEYTNNAFPGLVGVNFSYVICCRRLISSCY